MLKFIGYLAYSDNLIYGFKSWFEIILANALQITKPFFS